MWFDKKKLEKKINKMVSTAKVYMLKLFPKSKTNKSMKLLLADMKFNSSILMKLEIVGVERLDDSE